jgi:hypothetical protein
MSQQPKRPESLLQFLLMMVKGFITGLPKMILRNIVKIVIVTVAILVIHTYLLVDLNEGFWYDQYNKLSGMINVRDAETGAITFWAVAMMLLTQLWRKSRSKGITKTLGEVLSLPVWLGSCIRDAGKARFVALSVGAAIAILASIFITSNWTVLVLAVMTAFSFSARAQSLLMIAINLTISDFSKVFRKGRKRSPSLATSSLVVGGIAIGFVVSLFLPDIFILQIGLVALLIVLSILQAKNFISTSTAAGVLIFSGIQLILMKYNIAFADDGGLSEAGGTWSSWIGSPGSGDAVKMGATPAAAGATGALVGTFTGDFIDQVDYEWTDEEPYIEGPDEEVVIPPDEPLIDGEEELEDILDGFDLDGLSEEEIQDILDQIQDEIIGPWGPNPFDNIEDAISDLLNTDILDGLKDLFTGPGGQDIPSGKQAPGYLEWAKEILGGGFIQNALNNSYKNTFNTTWKQLSELYNSNLDGTALGDLIKSDIFDDVAKATKLKNWASTMDTTLKYAGGFFDALDWYGKGEGIFDSAVKGFGNAELMAWIGKKNPGLAVMEFVNFVGFGGTEAANCISPTKTITGTTNYIYDMFTENPDVLKQRLENGDYGPNVKNFVEAGNIMNDAVKDPEDFKNAWNEFVTVDEKGDSFDDMYKSSEDLWKVPEDTWKYSPRRFFSWAGKKATNSVIAVGEGAAHTGSWFGKVTSGWF